MCLDRVDANLTNSFQNVLEYRNNPIKTYKVVVHIGERDFPAIIPCRSNLPEGFQVGINVAKGHKLPTMKEGCTFEYESGFHSFVSREGAIDFKEALAAINLKIIEVFIDPQDIIVCGIQYGFEVIVSRKITIQSLEGIRI
jgi:hypothetical protein